MSATRSVLRAEKLCKRFGGLLAVNHVDLELTGGSVHAVIGPNGAGKSTLLDLLAREVGATSGRIILEDVDVTAWPQHRVAMAGVARSFQRTNVFAQFSVFENCRLAAQSRAQHFTRWFRAAEHYAGTMSSAAQALETTGLSGRSDALAATLSHGEQRQLEIAMALATEPRVLLLDEPLGGMGHDESARIVSLLARLAREHAILLVEHDMDAVFSLADRLTVMVDGTVLASGSPEAIRSNADVQRAYLGEDADGRSAVSAAALPA